MPTKPRTRKPRDDTRREWNFRREQKERGTFLKELAAVGGDLNAVCEAMGIGPKKVEGWCIRVPGFETEYQGIRQRFIEIAQGQIVGMVPQAIKAYEGFLEPESAPGLREKVATRVLVSEGVLRDQPGGPGVVVNNRTVTIIVQTERAKELLGRVKERTQVLAEGYSEPQND